MDRGQRLAAPESQARRVVAGVEETTMAKAFAKHTVSGEVYLVDIDMERDGQPVTALVGPLMHREYKAEHEFRVGAYAYGIDDFDLSTEDVEWAEAEFETGRLRIKSRSEL